MLENGVIRLRPWCDKDLGTLAKLRNDVELQGQLLARPMGSSLGSVSQWLTNVSSKADSLLLIITEANIDNCIGFIQITHIDSWNRRGELGICLNNESQGRNIGGQAISLICSYLKRTWNLRKLSLQVRADNKNAIKAYTKQNFEICGTLKENFFIDDRWHDIVLMERMLSQP